MSSVLPPLDCSQPQRDHRLPHRTFWCCTGPDSVSERQHKTFVDRGLDEELLSSDKLVYLEGDSSKSDLGIPPDVFTTVKHTLIAQTFCSYFMDVASRYAHSDYPQRLEVSSFEPHVKGMRNLIDLAHQSPNGWDQKLGPFPEELQLDTDVGLALDMARILASSGLHATSFRIGQISGAANSGAWSTTDWVPAIVKSSIALGNCSSDPSAVVSWIFPEAVSGTIVDAALRTENLPLAANLVHPRPVPWNFIISAMADVAQLPLIPFADWVQQLRMRAAHATAEHIVNIPGIKLLDLFSAAIGQGNIEYSTAKAQEPGDCIKLLEPLSEEDARRWMQYWKEKHFIA
ncbi:hypothetical protein B0H11DRAFT_2270049 [Mycena galericulata]|nr:hypothetical protein B0H11DRAFT_2270049 [Mycena galericulata]